MARRVEQGDDADLLALGIGNQRIHVRLGQLIILSGVIKRLVARLNGTRHLIAVIRRAVDRQAHVIQQEPQAVVAEGQFHMGIVAVGGIVDHLFQIINTEILPPAIKVDNPQEVVTARRSGLLVLPHCKDRRRHHAQDHDQSQHQRQHFVQRPSCLLFFHFLHPFPVTFARPSLTANPAGAGYIGKLWVSIHFSANPVA